MPFALLKEFFVDLGHMRFRVSRPGVLQGRRNFRRLKLGDAEAPKDVEPTLYMFQFFPDGVKAVL